MSRNRLTDAVFSRMKREMATNWNDYYQSKAGDLLDGLFVQQREFVEDPCRFKCALCPRRAGKSTCCVHYMLVTALRKPGASILYITITRGMAKRNAWGLLKKLCHKYNLDADFHETDLICRLQGDRVIQLAGCETTADIEKFRGGQHDLIILDECASWESELFQSLIDDALVPSLSDRLGTLAIIGTPGRVLAGPFYAASGSAAFQIERRADGTGRAMSRPWAERAEDGWDDVKFSYSFHSWTTKDNVAVPHIWKDQLETKERNGWTDEDPIWRREYRGEWVADDSGFVYRYSPDRNGWTPPDGKEPLEALPADHEWRFVIGIDLGFDDDFDIEVAAWSDTHPDFFHVDSYQMPGLIIPDIAAKLSEFIARYDPDVIVGDRGGLGKTILATLDDQYGIPIIAAEKTEKRDHIELLNSDLMSGRCHILKGSVLANQMGALQWTQDKRKGLDGKPILLNKEDRESSPNHACDAFVYIWRYCYHHFFRKKHVLPEVNSDAYWRQKMQEAVDRYEIEKQRRESLDWDDRLAEDIKLDPVEFGDWVN